MPRHTEPTNGGLVTVKDPTLLSPGQLAFIRNGVYLPGSDAIWRARGRSAFGTATASAIPVDGLRDIRFDNGNHYLIAHTSASYMSAAVGDTGTFGILTAGIGDGDQLEVVHYRNRFILFNGTQATASGLPSNRVVYLTATGVANTPTTRQHGMLMVPSGPNVTGSATSFSQTVTGYYEYWTTEVAKFTQDGSEMVMESGFSGNPTTIFVSSTGMAPLISLPILVNPGFTTHWRIYRSPKKDKESDKKFPSGFMIAEMSTATANALDSFAVSSATAFPSLVNVPGEVFSDFMSATSITSDNGVYARATGGALGIRGQGVYSFNFGGFAGNVRGIEVEFQASAVNSPVPVSVRIGRNRQSNGSFVPDSVNNLPAQFRQIMSDNIMNRNTAVKGALVTATANPGQTVVLGGSSDRWFPSDQPGLVDSDFNGNFMAIISPMRLGGALDFAVDYLKATVYYGGTVDSVIPFPTVVYTFGDISAQVSKNGTPPGSSTGDMYEDSLVVNDVTNPSTMRWSYPGDPEAFPGTYYLDFETRANDRITNIKVVNNRLVVFLEAASYRVNYLPSERDASFDRGKAIEVISGSYGCVNEMCATKYTPAGSVEKVAWVSDKGIHSTDAFGFDTFTDNLDWGGDRDGVGIANTTPSNDYIPIALVDDPDRENLVFYFRNDGTPSGSPYSALHIHYNDLDDTGKPKISGMVDMRNSIAGATASPASVCPVRRSTGATDIYIGYDGATGGGGGQVYRENGTDLPVSVPAVRWRHRVMYLSGFGSEWKLNNIYGHCGLVNFSSPPAITYQTVNYKTNGGEQSTSSKTYTYTASQTEKLHRVTFNQMCEGCQIFVTASGTGTYSQEFIVIDGEGFGVEDSGL